MFLSTSCLNNSLPFWTPMGNTKLNINSHSPIWSMQNYALIHIVRALIFLSLKPHYSMTITFGISQLDGNTRFFVSCAFFALLVEVVFDCVYTNYTFEHLSCVCECFCNVLRMRGCVLQSMLCSKGKWFMEPEMVVVAQREQCMDRWKWKRIGNYIVVWSFCCKYAMQDLHYRAHKRLWKHL